MKLSIELSDKSIFSAIKTLVQYENGLRQKTRTLVDRLLDEGIEVAQQNSGEYGQFISFTKKLDDGYDVHVGALIARDKNTIMRTWLYYGSLKFAFISPLLMAEFGSGWLAEVLSNVSGVGQGTFPNQTHAFDEGGWWYMTEDKQWVHTEGEAPTHPMYNAQMAIISRVDQIAKEVFKDGE